MGTIQEFYVDEIGNDQSRNDLKMLAAVFEGTSEARKKLLIANKDAAEEVLKRLTDLLLEEWKLLVRRIDGDEYLFLLEK